MIATGAKAASGQAGGRENEETTQNNTGRTRRVEAGTYEGRAVKIRRLGHEEV